MPFYRKEWTKMAKEGAIPTELSSLTNTAEPIPTMNELESIKTQLTQQAEHLLKQQIAAEPIKGENNFLNYLINKERVIFSGMYSNIYVAFNPSLIGGSTLICRIFKPTSEIDPIKDLYLKVIRFIGRQSPHIIATMDIFYDDSNQIYLFQEYGDAGNCLEYLRAGNFVTLQQMISWSTSIWSALDFLGENALVHMNLNLKHVLLKHPAKPNEMLLAKLGGFRDVRVYWDVEKMDVIEIPKRSWDQIRYAVFKAPETCSKKSDSETYNPIEADVWSFGATFFYMLARTYPFDPSAVENLTQVDEAIHKRIWAVLKMEDNCKNWFYGLLRADPVNRVKFEDILRDPWYQAQATNPPANG